MAAFPVYPMILFPGFDTDTPPAVARSEPEDGMVKQLQTTSRVLVRRTLNYLIKSKADRDSFKVWHRDTVHRGADWFDWTDPYDNAVKTARIVKGAFSEKPQRKALDRWVLTFDLEVYE